MTDYFDSNATELEVLREGLEAKGRTLSMLRLLFFVGFVVAGIVGLAKGLNALFAVAGVCLIVFIGLCIKHNSVKKETRTVNARIDANARYIARMKGDFTTLTDIGADFVNNHHDYTSDLDIFGAHSIFALYNTSHFILGRREFANLLSGRNLPSKEEILKRQGYVKIFGDCPEFLVNYEAEGALNSLEKAPSAIMDLASATAGFKKGLRVLYTLFPLLWIFPLVALVLGSNLYKILALLVILVNIGAWFIFSGRLEVPFKAISKITKQANSIEKRLSFLLKADEDIKEAAGDFLSEDALASIKELRTACVYCSARQQPLSALILNAVVPYDLFCSDKLLTWAQNHGEAFLKDIDGIAKIEALMSCSVPGLVSKTSCFPEIESDRPAYFEGEDMTHPLLSPETAVSNSVKLDSQTALITGSNMSGKTTLIRTVGIICVLGYTGAMVPASKAKMSVMRIAASMRITDSIGENMSTFKAELVKIGRIVEVCGEGKPMLFLIDEIFRGTNSADRTDGAEAVLKKLAVPYASGFMTTHDYALCDRAQAGIMKNVTFYHFSERYEDDSIIFDYKLQKGVSHESNAKFLMRLVGIM